MDIIGYWITELRDEAYCAPQELVGEMPREIRNCVAEYLDAGVHCIQYGGCSWCRFHCGKPSQEMGSGERTDGRWVWPDGLSHYVRDHGIILPDEFVSHVLQQSRKARSIRLKTVSLASRLFGSKEAKPRELNAREFPSTAFWMAWCESRKSEAFRERLRRARMEAEKLLPKEFERQKAEQVAKLVRQYGLTGQLCCYRECHGIALGGKAVCAEHAMDVDWIKASVTQSCFRIPPELLKEFFIQQIHPTTA